MATKGDPRDHAISDSTPSVGQINEAAVQFLWNAHPCGDHIVGGLHNAFDDEYERFFTAYDARRYRQEGHIPACLDRTDWRGRKVLEIGLGQGADSEQLIRRGGSWSGVDHTQESVHSTDGGSS